MNVGATTSGRITLRVLQTAQSGNITVPRSTVHACVRMWNRHWLAEALGWHDEVRS